MPIFLFIKQQRHYTVVRYKIRAIPEWRISSKGHVYRGKHKQRVHSKVFYSHNLIL